MANPQRAGQLRSPEPPARGSPRDLAIGIDAGEIDGPVRSVSDRRTAGAFRSSRTDRGAQVLPPAGATVPPSIPLLRRRPRTGLDQAGSTPELRRPIARRAPAAGQSEQDA